MWYWLLRAGAIAALKVFFNLTVEGAENLPKKSNFIIAANHASLLDPVVILAAIPRRIYWIAMRTLYRIKFVRWFIVRVEAVPAGRSSERLVDLLMNNKSVGLFSEGGVSRDGTLKEFKTGAALLALKTGRPVVPCAILGSYRALPRTEVFPRFSSITVKIGTPLYLLKEFEDVIDDIRLQEGTVRIRNSIKEMIYVV